MNGYLSASWKRGVTRYLILKNSKLEWTQGILLSALVLGFMMGYYVLRGRPLTDLYTFNKALSLASTLLLLLSISFSPWAQLTGGLRRQMALRRPLGLLGSLGMVVHILLSLFFIEKFSWEWYNTPQRLISMGLGAWSTYYLVCTCYYSFLSTTRSLSRERLKQIHRRCYWALYLALGHVMMLGKQKKVIQWLGSPEGLPGGVLYLLLSFALFSLLLLAIRTLRR